MRRQLPIRGYRRVAEIAVSIAGPRRMPVPTAMKKERRAVKIVSVRIELGAIEALEAAAYSADFRRVRCFDCG